MVDFRENGWNTPKIRRSLLGSIEKAYYNIVLVKPPNGEPMHDQPGGDERHLRIIGAASGLGARDRGCADGPVAFHHAQAWHDIASHPRLDWGRTLFPPDGEATRLTQRIAALCEELADEVGAVLSADELPLVIGGDHSVAIGTWSGVARFAGAPLGLLWIDAHLDCHTPETTHSGAIHGMPLACLLGHGDRRLIGLGLPGAQLDPAYTAVLGVRSHEPEETELPQRLGVRIIDQEEITRRGFTACFADAIEHVARAPAGFGVSLDLDAIDPLLAPGVGSPEPDGVLASELIAALAKSANLPGLRALEIVEYNPDRDHHGRTAHLMATLIGKILRSTEK
jgi:arginase